MSVPSIGLPLVGDARTADARHSHITPHATGKRHALHDVLDLLVLVLIGVAAWFLWPTALGGSTRFVVVQGHSMEPVYHLGDAVVVKELAHPQVGDVIVFSIPAGEPAAGMLVVHRIHGVRADGTFETKGDNRRYPDTFRIRRADILGSPAWTLPHFGRLVGLAADPLVVGATAGTIARILLLPRTWHEHRIVDVDVDVDVDAGDGEAGGDQRGADNDAER